MSKDQLKSNQLETSSIGCLFINSRAAFHVLNRLSPEAFVNKIYRDIFNVSSRLHKESKTVDQKMVLSEFEGDEDLYKYKNAIKKAINFCNPEDVEQHCKKLNKLLIRRRLHKKKENFHPTDMSTSTSELMRKLDGMVDLTYMDNPDVAQTVSEIEKQQEPQLQTGIKRWDSWFYKKGGLGLGTTELIFGRSGHGKTYYLFRKECELAKQGNKILHFHLEDTAFEAANRVGAVLPEGEYPQARENILIITQHRYLEDIIRDIRYYCNNFDISGVAIDHIGRVNVEGLRADQKNQKMIVASNKLTDLCKDMEVLGMFSAQPNKSYKQREGWDNLLREEDLKYASELFEDAFVITTLFRPNIYPELRTTGNLDFEEGVNNHCIKDKDGNLAPYDSVYLSQIKNRRQRLRGSFLKMVQSGDKLDMLDEYKSKEKKVPF